MERIVNTPCGSVQGVKANMPGVTAFKGIRYATAERWCYPEIVENWEGVYQADHYGNCSYQPRAFYNEEDVKEKQFYYVEFRKGETYTYDEDCLFLNIWAPENAKEGDNLPVLFYIHGGGFTGGCGHEKHFDGPRWAEKGVIAVTVNYRLGPMGFVCLPELEEEAGHTGNYGLYDQMTAMKWVQNNISAFGGDKNNVTIMGQSAGAMSVQQHVLSPLTDGLFHKAVMSSGGGVSKMMTTASAEKRYAFWKTVMERAGCKDLASFRKLPADRLFAVWQTVKKEMKAGMVASPVIDGTFVVGSGVDLLAANKHKQIPYMAGSTSHDLMPPIILDMANKWCQAQGKPSFARFFDRKLPGDNNGAWHSSDLWYWFGTLKNGWRPWQQKDYALSEQMVSYLTNFAKNGDPNGAGLPQWKAAVPGERKVLCMGEGDTRMAKPSGLKLWYTMFTNKAVGE